MQILSHRGFWVTPEEKNSEIAFKRSFENGWGVETDLRDQGDKLVISHDMPGEKPAMDFEYFLDLYQSYHKTMCLALNIKADGLLNAIRTTLAKRGISTYFLFDMSFPEALLCKRGKIPFYSRQSEYETEIQLAEECAGIWLDAFEGEWYTMDVIDNHLKAGKQVAIVSPELHKRPYSDFWAELRSASFLNSNNLFLCTDFPADARAYFKL